MRKKWWAMLLPATHIFSSMTMQNCPRIKNKKIEGENMMSIQNDLLAIKKIFVDYPNYYQQQKREFGRVSSERQDLLHVLELAKLNAAEMSKIMRQLKEVQIKRRQIKNNLEVLEVVNTFSINFNNNKHKDYQIDTVINTVENIVNKERKYTMRVRTDLQELVEVSE